MAFTGVNFRLTSPYVSDPAGSTYCIDDAWPVTRAGIGPFGWRSGGTGNARNRTTSSGVKFAGVNFVVNTAPKKTWSWQLPNGPGVYRVRVAIGDESSPQNNLAVIKDGAATRLTINAATPSGRYLQAQTATTTYSPSEWEASPISAELTFDSGVMDIECGRATAGAEFSSAVVHVAVEFVSGGGSSATASGVTVTSAASIVVGNASGQAAGTANGVTLTAAGSLTAGSASGEVLGTLAFQAAGLEFGRRTGLGISTFALDSGASYRYSVHADGLTLGAAIITSAAIALDSNGKLPNLSSALITPGLSYRIVAIRQADGEAATFRMTAS